MIIAKAPMRVSLFGGGTDLPFYLEAGHTGMFLSMAIDKYVYCMIHPRYDDEIWLNYSEKEKVQQSSDIEHPLIRHCMVCGHYSLCGVEISYVSDIPGKGSGLGSSSAFALATIFALQGFDPRPFQYDPAKKALTAERAAGKKIGIQDQVASLSGGMNKIYFEAVKNYHTDEVDPKHLLEHLMLFELPARKSESQGDELLSAVASNKDRNMDLMHLIKAQCEEAIECLREEDYEGMGHLLGASWDHKRKLTEGVSTPEIDEIYRKALGIGAWGGKVCGAGGGGFLLLMADPKDHMDLKEELGLRHVPFGIDRLGARVVFNDE